MTGRSSRPKASEIAADTKRRFIPLIRNHYHYRWPCCSYLFVSPTQYLSIARCTTPPRLPYFNILVGDPVDHAIRLQSPHDMGERIPFLCAANERRPGGDWETSAAGYEEQLCRRSNLAATMATPGPDAPIVNHYPITMDAALFSSHVVVYRAGADRYYEEYPPEHWMDLPVISMPPTRWPKLNYMGSAYSFAEERNLMRQKIQGALRVALYNGFTSIVIGDYGLGKLYRNPPEELAEIWRDIFLFDPDLRGQFHRVDFVFDDPHQSTLQLIHYEQAKRASASGRPKGMRDPNAQIELPDFFDQLASDHDIFRYTFSPEQIDRAMSQQDPRYSLQTLMS